MNVIRFIKNWTLPISIASGITIYLIFYLVPALDGAAMVLAPVCNTILPLFMSLVLFIIFCKVDFTKLIPVKWIYIICLTQTMLVALITMLTVELHLSGRSLILAEAILTCIICPGASAAPVVTAKLGGNLEQMTTYTYASNIITALLIPVCFPLIEHTADISFMASFLTILKEVCMVLILPMLVAYVVKHTMPRFHKWIIGVKDLSYYMWGVTLVFVSGITAKNIIHADTTAGFLTIIALLGLMLCIVQFAVGRFIGHYFHVVIEAGQAMGQKNTTFAIWIAYTYLNPLSSIGPGCYILWQNIINSIEIWDYRKKNDDRQPARSHRERASDHRQKA